MSFGFSVGDFISVGKLAYDLFAACKAASEDYKDLGDICRAVGIAVEACRPHDPFTVLRRQNAETISVLAEDCGATLRRLQDLLGYYKNMNTVRTVGRKIGFAMDKQERNEIRTRLQEHLSAINAFMSGVQMETLGLTVRLVLKMIEGQSEGSSPAKVLDLIEDPGKLDALLKDFSSDGKITQAELGKNQESLKQKLKDAAGQDASTGTSAPKKESSDRHIETRWEKSFAIVKANSVRYDPRKFDWFANGGSKWLRPVRVEESPFLASTLPVAQIRYSEADEYLCVLPEGWSITPTLIERDLKMEEAYFYVYNNLSSAADNISKVGRTYCSENPFLTDSEQVPYGEVTPGKNVRFEGRVKCARTPSVRFFVNYPNYAKDLASAVYASDYYDFAGKKKEDCAGFYYNGMCFDLMDELSRELAQMLISEDGKRQLLTGEKLTQSLPESWYVDPDEKGLDHHIYMNVNTGEESTVHPARFYDPTAEEAACLPPGWHRRLDAWGNLFFVDDNTKSAVRDDPRFNPNIDASTGMPQGWMCIEDHRGDPFFYRSHGKVIMGTYMPQGMNDKSLKNKKILKSEPKSGDNPALLDRQARPRDRERLEKVQTADSKKEKIREMTPAEKQHYYKLFACAPKQNRLFISLGEAIAHCQAFDILPGIATQILLASDANRDRRFDCDEYATALHRIRIAMENQYAATKIPPPTGEEQQQYEVMFDQVLKPDKLTLSLEEVMEMCASYDLPRALVEAVWLKADANHDQDINPTEFANGMHQILKNYERREAIRMKIEMPTIATKDDTPTTPSSPATQHPPDLEQTRTRVASFTLSSSSQRNLDAVLGIEGEDVGEAQISKGDDQSGAAVAATATAAGEESRGTREGGERSAM